MKRLKLNPEFFYRHLAVCLLMFGMGCWFGYDGFVRCISKDSCGRALREYREVEAAGGLSA